MTRTLILTALLLLVLCPAAPAATSALDADAAASLKAGVEAMRTATFEKDFALIAERMHPKIVAEMGGQNAVVGLLEASYGQMEASGFEIVTLEADLPSQAYIVGEELVVIVPRRLVLDSPDARVTSDAYLVASRPKEGGSWVFIDGSGIRDAKALQIIFPGLPEDVSVPEPSRSVETYETADESAAEPGS